MSKPSNEVYARYHAKTYKRYMLNLRKDRDGKLIDMIEKNKAAGISPTDTIKALIKTK